MSLETALHDAIRDRAAAEAVVAEKAATVNRIHLALAITRADLPPGALIEVTTWEDEPNGDGTYDVDLGEAYSADKEDHYGDLGGQGAIGAGHYDGDDSDAGTDWDIFLAKPYEPTSGDLRVISVDKVNAWVAEHRRTGK